MTEVTYVRYLLFDASQKVLALLVSEAQPPHRLLHHASSDSPSRLLKSDACSLVEMADEDPLSHGDMPFSMDENENGS